MTNKREMIGNNDIPRPEKPELWRERYAEINTKFTEKQQGVYLWELSKNGIKSDAARVAKVSVRLVTKKAKDDPKFRECEEVALRDYANWLLSKARGQFVDGVDNLKVNRGVVVKDDKGNQIVEKIFPNNPMMQMEMKRVFPEYREKTEIDLNIKGGVLIAPATLSPDAWIAQNAKSEENLLEDDG